MVFLSEISLMVWKMVIIRKRHWFLTLSEILIPISFFLLIAYVYGEIDAVKESGILNTLTYYPFVTDAQLYASFPSDIQTVHYTPNNPDTARLMADAVRKFYIPVDAIGYPNEQAILKANRDVPTLVLVTFYGDLNQSKLNYSIRYDYNDMNWLTDQLYSPYDLDLYGNSGFAALQLAIDTVFIEYTTGRTQLPYEIGVQQILKPPLPDSAFQLTLLRILCPLATVLGFLIVCPAIVKSVVDEKDSGIKELMKMVGMKQWMIWFGWYIHTMGVHLLTICVIVFCMKYPLFGASLPSMYYCGTSVYFVFLLLYVLAMVTMCFFISTLFTRPALAMIFTILIWIISYVLALLFTGSNHPLYINYLISLLPNGALFIGYNAMNPYFENKETLTWQNIGQLPTSTLTLVNVLWMLTFDIVLYACLTVYIDNIHPGQYGVRKSIYFPITSLRKCFRRKPAKQQVPPPEMDNMETVEDGQGQTVGILLDRVSKKYGGSTVAVDDLTLPIYEGQITALLGHNGAGKTTTMSMLTGMIEATSGSIYIGGVNIRDDITRCRHSMGLCPQHNAYFNDFTVGQHLVFFARLKGRSSEEANVEAAHLMRTLHIYEKRDELARNLSGGMKRKLCLGMAIIGRTKVLILDEPTSGMDPESRRDMWNLLLSWRQSKTILITTHFMEEADVLGDWIAIMANGRLQCYGTPLFLKKKYATGYHLSLMLDNSVTDQNRRNVTTDVTTAVQRTISKASMIRQTGRMIVYQLPFEYKTDFPDLFNNLEKKMTSLRIEHISVAVTTLEEVFLKAKSAHGPSNDTKELTTDINKPDLTHYGIQNFLLGLFWKRIYFLKRTWIRFVIPFFICTLLTLLTIHWMQHLGTGAPPAGPSLPLHLNMYHNSTVYFSSNQTDNRMKDIFRELVETVSGAPPIEVASVSQAILEEAEKDLNFYMKNIVVAAEMNETRKNELSRINALYASQALHSLPIAIDLLMNTILRTSSTDRTASISTTNARPTPEQIANQTTTTAEHKSELEAGIACAILIPIALLFVVGGGFLHFPNAELRTSYTQIQLMTGISSALYWLSNFYVDFIVYFILIVLKLCIVTAIVQLAYTVPILRTGQIFGPLLIVFLAYGTAKIPYTYVFAHKKSPAGAFSLLLIVGMLLSIVPMTVLLVLEVLPPDSSSVKIGNAVKHVLIVTQPQFAVSYVLYRFGRVVVQHYNWGIMRTDAEERALVCTDPEFMHACCGGDETVDCLRFYDFFRNETFGIGWYTLEMMVGCAVYLTLLTFGHTSCCQRMKAALWRWIRHFKIVKFRNNGIEAQPTITMVEGVLNVRRLRKFYKFQLAVDNVTFDVKNGECYGLLGVNGAGKTTTFKMLVRELIMDNGTVFIVDSNSRKRIPITKSQYLTRLGYCPQFDALNLTLTGKELLMTMALFRGYNPHQVEQIAQMYISIFGLNGYENRPCGRYSGGNKRKLCLALAFVGYPPVILMDEPSSGVDPSSRRIFWSTLGKIQRLGNVAFVLCSHSMEECEVLCNRIGILKGGRIREEGTLADLKRKFENGYSVILKLTLITGNHHSSNNSCSSTDLNSYYNNNDVEDDVSSPISVTVNNNNNVNGDLESGTASRAVDVEKLKRDFERLFNNCELRDAHTGVLQYHVKDTNKSWSTMFQLVEAFMKRNQNIIEDYSISEVSLEDIFLTVARL